VPWHQPAPHGSLGLIPWLYSQPVLAFGLFEIAFYFAYRFGMSFGQTTASPFWFPDSVLLCALLMTSPGRWWIFILGALPIRLFTDVARDLPLWFLLATFANDSAKGLLTALVLRRFVRNPMRLETVREFALYCLFAVALFPAASAVAGAAARHALGHGFWPAWEQWFLGDALTHLVVTPALLYWVLGAPRDMRWPPGKRCLETALLAVGLLATGYLAFDASPGAGFAEPRFYAPVPFIFWAAIRFGMFGASGAIAAMAILSVEAALEGRGPFSGQSPAGTAMALQQFLLLRAAPLYLVAILIEQKTAVERSLQESRERISLAAIAADLGLWEWDIARHAIWLTSPSRPHSEFGQPTRMDFDEFIRSLHPDDRADVTRALAQCVEGGADYESEYRVLLPDGQIRWVATVGRIDVDAEGKPIRLRGVSRDTTRSRQVELQVQQQRAELAHLSRIAVFGELSGSLAHELNQPLAAILTNARAAQRLLAQGRPDLTEFREILDDIVGDDRRAAEIIQRLRQLFRRGDIQPQPIGVNELVRAVLKIAQRELTGNDVELRTKLADNLPLIGGDPVQLQQVLLNLIANACHAMSDVERPARRLAVRTGRSADANVCVTVSDCGRGIPRDDLTRIFDPFFTTRPEGMGLGLTVCRTIINAHRGKLWAENNADRGASFHFTLPEWSGGNASQAAMVAPEA
jgi:signal transduction histidine kinase